ncbi:MAG: DNA-protecting protein DprA [Muribaculaceae bacterium]|nr:DNA-protecting protein DprA [Muribaculaceae bacterium]
MDWSSIENVNITYRLLNLRGFGAAKANRLLWSLRTNVNSVAQYEEQVIKSLSPAEAQSFMSHVTFCSEDWDFKYLSVLDENLYPSRLRSSLRQNTPTILTYRGNTQLLKKTAVGFSGSRKVSEKGLWITRDSVAQLVKNDICIVSGNAGGVDLEAHRAALENGGTTIMVLPEGIGSFHIRKQLKDVWDWERVLVISEFMPQAKWLASRAMQRNQTIIGLSDALCVIEAGETGGSMDAGRKAMSMGRDLFVPYYKEVPESASGNNILIEMGAKKLLRKRDNHTNVDAIIGHIQNARIADGVLPLLI